jgi:hypothetical protein
MSRFEIEDIVSQDKRGIVFRAHDLERGHTVALRRFFPFGQDGGGLMEDEADAFRIAAQRLLGITHPSLRSVFSGAVDPIDEMPYIVAEWVDGAKLADVLAGENLDPRLIIQLLRHALEVSLSLSEILREEAVWVETETDSIFVGSEESGKGFVFWLSPYKWLGAEFGSRKLSAIVDLGEHLAGWKGKLIGDNAGHGLGGWLKWMKNNPDASLAQALESLPTFTTANETPPPPKPSSAPPVASEPALSLKQPPSISPILIAACLGLLLAVGGLAYFRIAAKPTSASPQSENGRISPPLPVPGLTPQPTKETERTVSDVNAHAKKLALENETANAAAKAPAVPKTPPAAVDAP